MSDVPPFSGPLSRRTLLRNAAASAVAASSLGALLAACGASSGSVGALSGTITIWDRTGDLFQVFDATIASFNKKYPNIKVKHEAVDINSKLPSTLTTGTNVPDGAFYDDSNVPIIADQLYDISDVIKPYTNNIVPFKLRAATHNGKVIGVPYDLDPGLLYYREDLLTKAGIDPTTIATYDDLITASHTIQAKLGSSVKPIHLEQSPFLLQLWVEMFANQQGTSLIDASGKLQVNSASYLNIMQWIKRVVDEGVGSRQEYFSTGDISAIESDQVVFYPWAIWFVYGADNLFKTSKGKWRAMQLPAWSTGGGRGANMGGSTFVIPKKAANPHLAWLFYEHLMFSEEGYKAVYGPNKVYSGGINTSLPSYLPAQKTQLFQNSDGLDGQNLWDVATGTVSQIPGNYYYPTWYTQAVDYFAANVQRLMDGQLSPQDVLTQSENQITTNLINHP